MKRIVIILSVALFVVAAVATTGFALFLRQNVCTADKYREATSPILSRWRSVEASAKMDSTRLAEHIATMRIIRLDFDQAEYPSCAHAVHREMSASLDSYIAGYDLMLAGGDRALIDEHFRQGDQHLNAAAITLSELD